MLFTSVLFALSLTFSVPAFAHPHPHPAPDFDKLFAREVPAASEGGASSPFSAKNFPAVKAAMEGNARFRQNRNETLLRDLVENGQKPPFMMVSCSDSRAPEASIFDSQPGTFFMERNIANQYKPGDENAQSVMAYGVRVLGVQHVVVMGHYGCGGIAAAIASAPKTNINVATHIVQTWIGDVRALYLSSNRSEIVEMREKNLKTEASGGTVEEPNVQEPGFRALVEENVKMQVKRIAQSSVISNLNEEVILKLNKNGTPKEAAPAEGGAAEEGSNLIPVFVHGWVHDIESGEVIDLNISTGPAGFENFVPGEAAPESPSASSSAPAETATSSIAPEESATTTTAPEGEASATASASSTAEAPAEGTASPSAGEVEGEAAARKDVLVHGSYTQPMEPAAGERKLRKFARRGEGFSPVWTGKRRAA